jgi:hypothetical protein
MKTEHKPLTMMRCQCRACHAKMVWMVPEGTHIVHLKCWKCWPTFKGGLESDRHVRAK